MKEANQAANRVFKGTVDFERSTPELLALVTEYLATLTPEMMRRVTSLQEGILLRSKFLPTVADFHALVKELEENDNRFKRSHTHYQYFQPSCEPPPPSVVFNPFPKLTVAFEDEPHLLQTNFDALFDASRALAVSGKEAARRVLDPSLGAKPTASAQEAEVEF